LINQLKTTGDQSKKTCVVASSRVWNKNMPNVLSARTGYEFIFISDTLGLTVEKLTEINPYFVFFPHWSNRIDQSIYTQFECIIFHMTDLPFGRGGSPLQNLISMGIYETKISALRCIEEMDAGPIYLKKPLSLYGSAEEIFLRASTVIEDMIVEILANSPKAIPQEGMPTVFKRRKPEDGDLTTAQSLKQAFDFIRMLDADGYPHAFLNVGPFKIEFTRASMKTDQVIADVCIKLIDNNKLG
jgi:methionyl-tRNA formyltransferase